MCWGWRCHGNTIGLLSRTSKQKNLQFSLKCHAKFCLNFLYDFVIPVFYLNTSLKKKWTSKVSNFVTFWRDKIGRYACPPVVTQVNSNPVCVRKKKLFRTILSLVNSRQLFVNSCQFSSTFIRVSGFGVLLDRTWFLCIECSRGLLYFNTIQYTFDSKRFEKYDLFPYFWSLPIQNMSEINGIISEIFAIGFPHKHCFFFHTTLPYFRNGCRERATFYLSSVALKW